MVARVPLVQRFLSLLLLCGNVSFIGSPCRGFLTLLLARRILQYRALNVDLVHEVKRVAWPLKLIVKALRVLLFHKLFKLAHASFLSGSRVTSEQPRFLLEDREILHPIVVVLFCAMLLALWIAIHGTLPRWRLVLRHSDYFWLGSKLHWQTLSVHVDDTALWRGIN